LLEPLGIYPERHRARDFPTEKQLEAIKAEGCLP
jgi:hypothetical protein